MGGHSPLPIPTLLHSKNWNTWAPVPDRLPNQPGFHLRRRQ